MDLGFQIYVIFVTLSLIAMTIAYLLHRKEVKKLSSKINRLLVHSSHTFITTDFPSDDITEMVNELNNLLETYQEQINELQKKDNVVKETITNLAHDLRTPITAIRGYAQILLQSTELSAENLEAVKIINERIELLNQLLNQLFLYARLEAGELNFNTERIDINNVLRSVLVSFYQSFEAKGLEPLLAISEEPFIIEGDKNALIRIFSNVVSNAIVHGKGGYKISSFRETNKFIILFSNQTNDIENSDIEKIFERFYTTDKSRSKKTTGLGLSISKKLVEQMNGEISAKLDKNIFTIKIEFFTN